jgi:diguanylate cyclase (GGDEF)-like protein
MKVLIIDRDTMFSSLLAAKIRAAGHEVFECAVKNDGIEQIGTKKIDAVFFDPAPLADPKAVMLQVRRQVHTFPYMILMGEGADRAAGIKAGCNDGISKPFDPAMVDAALANAERMVSLINRIGDESFDFPSAGGVISKSAFNQLFLSAIDRVGRYGENAHVLFISIPNYDDIALDDGKYAADYAVSKLAQTLVRLRRQSDILAQTGAHEFALLLQRPQTETESLDAAKRFSSALDSQDDITSNGVTELHIEVRLTQLPTGGLDFDRRSRIKGMASRQAG